MPGTAVFPHPGKDTTPLALRANVEHNHVLHESVIIVSASTANVPHVPASEAFTLDDLGYDDDGIQHLSVRYGFSDEPDIPRALRQACAQGVLGLHASPTSTRRRTSCREGPSAGRRRRGWPGGARRCSSSSRTTPPTPLPTSPSRDRTVPMGSDVEI